MACHLRGTSLIQSGTNFVWFDGVNCLNNPIQELGWFRSRFISWTNYSIDLIRSLSITGEIEQKQNIGGNRIFITNTKEQNAGCLFQLPLSLGTFVLVLHQAETSSIIASESNPIMDSNLQLKL